MWHKTPWVTGMPASCWTHVPHPILHPLVSVSTHRASIRLALDMLVLSRVYLAVLVEMSLHNHPLSNRVPFLRPPHGGPRQPAPALSPVLEVVALQSHPGEIGMITRGTAPIPMILACSTASSAAAHSATEVHQQKCTSSLLTMTLNRQLACRLPVEALLLVPTPLEAPPE